MTTLEKIRAEIEQIADEEQKHDKKWAMGLRYAVKIIDKYAEQEPSDTIAYHDDFATALIKISEYEDRKRCEDAVSRQAVIDNIKNGFHWESVNGITAETVLKQVIHDVEIMPSVQPKAKTGHWIEDKTTYAGQGIGNYKCSVCDRINGSWIKDMPSVYPNFCWWCGAEMKGGE